MPITADRCCELLSDAMRRIPEDIWSQESLEWYSEVVSIVSAFNQGEAISLRMHLPSIANLNVGPSSLTGAASRERACQQFTMEANILLRRLQLETNAFTTAHIPAGKRFDYFEEIRSKVASAQSDILFCDPYISADFVPTYLPIVPTGVQVRLLSTERYAAELEAACKAFHGQYGWGPAVRVMPNKAIHDRHLVIDRKDVWQSGASFKDGPKNAGTTVNQIVDTARVIIPELEEVWARARPVL